MATLPLKVADALDRGITLASQRQGITRSELMRRAVHLYLNAQDDATSRVSAYGQAPHLAGTIEGAPTDLATNPEYLKGYGGRAIPGCCSTPGRCLPT